jgi:ABC-type bacteriocin/lantibiotic exporter with double-glycine peptidase domain
VVAAWGSEIFERTCCRPCWRGLPSLVLVCLNRRLFLVTWLITRCLFLVNQILGKKLLSASRGIPSFIRNLSKGVLFPTESIDLTRSQTAEQFALNRQWKQIEDLCETSGRFAWFDTAYDQIQANMAILAGVLDLMAGGLSVAHRSITLGALLSFSLTGWVRNPNRR